MKLLVEDRVQAIVDYFLARDAENLKGPPFIAQVTRIGRHYMVSFTVLLGGPETATTDGGEFFVPVGTVPTEESEHTQYAVGVASAVEDALQGWWMAGRSFDA